MAGRISAQTSKPDSLNIIEGVYVPTTEQKNQISQLNLEFARKIHEFQQANPDEANKGKRKKEALKLNQQREMALKQALGEGNYLLYQKNRLSKAYNDTLKQNQLKKVEKIKRELGLSAEQVTQLYSLKTSFERQKRMIGQTPAIGQEEAREKIVALKKVYLEKIKLLLPVEKYELFVKSE